MISSRPPGGCGEERLAIAGVADGLWRGREVCDECGGQGFRAGLSQLGEQSARYGRARLPLDRLHVLFHPIALRGPRRGEGAGLA
jgi:hypothetical protein